jgi:hypothetical protein
VVASVTVTVVGRELHLGDVPAGERWGVAEDLTIRDCTRWGNAWIRGASRISTALAYRPRQARTLFHVVVTQRIRPMSA